MKTCNRLFTAAVLTVLAGAGAVATGCARYAVRGTGCYVTPDGHQY